jgi:hypothetical protein
MAIIYLGNSAPLYAEESSNQITTVNTNILSNAESLEAIEGLWPSHSNEPPAWVDTVDPELAKEIAKKFSTKSHKCTIGKPENWEQS